MQSNKNDGEWHGVHRRMLAQASRNGYFVVLNRETGKDLLTAPFMDNNWSLGGIKRVVPFRIQRRNPSATALWPAPVRMARQIGLRRPTIHRSGSSSSMVHRIAASSTTPQKENRKATRAATTFLHFPACFRPSITELENQVAARHQQ